MPENLKNHGAALEKLRNFKLKVRNFQTIPLIFATLPLLSKPLSFIISLFLIELTRLIFRFVVCAVVVCWAQVTMCFRYEYRYSELKFVIY